VRKLPLSQLPTPPYLIFVALAAILIIDLICAGERPIVSFAAKRKLTGHASERSAVNVDDQAGFSGILFLNVGPILFSESQSLPRNSIKWAEWSEEVERQGGG
jgi:hypothetical protein